MKRPNENNEASRKKSKLNEISQDLGIILSITLQNFMCHDHLNFDFDPHINFIIGQNGSGKSAILTGIMLALGGKSSITGRYSNIKGFVKNGKNKARISVALKNCGPCAYKPELYGNKVIVEREISLEGNSSYKLKSAEGKIVDQRKDELINILQKMDIQIDNPVSILTQETSRNFLLAKTGKEEKLYEFFYRGTGLKKLEEDYQLSVASNEDCEKMLHDKKLALDAMEKEIKQLEKLKESDEKLDELKREAFWALVMSAEKELEEKNIAKDKLVKEIEITKKEAENSKNKYNEESLALEQAEQKKADLHKEIDTQRKTLKELSDESESCADDARRCQGQVDLYKREERKLLHDVRGLEQAIEEHQRKDQTDYENERRHRDEQIAQLKQAIEDAENLRAEFESQQESLWQEQNSKMQEIQHKNTEIIDLKYKRDMRVKDMTQMTNSKKNRQILFGEHTSAVLQDINRIRSRFKKLPRGPIGLDLEVRDPKWNNAVEACIKPHMLRSFCCDNSQDSFLLTQILQKYYTDRMPSVIVSPFLPHMHDVSRHKAQTDIPTVLDMLVIKDPVIANCLIDQLSIENIILIEDITTANNIMLDNPPRQCYSAFLQNCDEILLNPYRFYSASRKPNSVLSKNVDEHYLQQLQEEIGKLNAKIKAKENEITELQMQLHNYPKKLEYLKKKLVDQTTIKSTAYSKIKELEQFEEPKNVPEMFVEYDTLKADLVNKQVELREAEEKLAAYTIKYKEAHEKQKNQKTLVTRLRHEHESLGNTINQCSRNKELLASSKKEFETELKASERRLQQLIYHIEEEEKSIKKTIEDRKKVDKKSRMQTQRTYEEIDLQIQEMQKVISEQSNSRDKTSLLQKYTEKTKKLFEAKQEYKQIERQNKQIGKMMKKRKEKALDIFVNAKFKVNFCYSVFLRGNGFVGQLKFKQNGLQLEASPQRTDTQEKKSGGKKACSSLSGGERSFVTIAFLLALWDKIQMPFRILDEYDVFMDSNNRHMSINLILKQSDVMSDVQFIFLSPLDLPQIVESRDNITVLKMPPPQRIGLSNMEE